MSDPIAATSPQLEVVRQVYAALNRNDIAAMVQEFDPDVEWLEPSDFPGGGVHRGREAVEAHARRARAAWAEGTCELERLIPAGDKVVSFDYVHVRLKDEAEWREGRLAAVYCFRNGLVIQARVFLDREEALAWAGAASPTD